MCTLKYIRNAYAYRVYLYTFTYAHDDDDDDKQMKIVFCKRDLNHIYQTI